MLKAKNISVLVILAMLMSAASLCVSFSCVFGSLNSDGVAQVYEDKPDSPKILIKDVRELATLSTNDYFLKKPEIRDNGNIEFGLVLNNVGSYGKFTFTVRNEGKKIGRVKSITLEGLERSNITYTLTGLNVNDIINISEDKKVSLVVSYANDVDNQSIDKLIILDKLKLIIDIE